MDPSFSDKEFGLVINGHEFDIPKYTNTIPTQIIETNTPVRFVLTFYEDSGPHALTHAEMTFGKPGSAYNNDNTAIIWDKIGDLVAIKDPGEIMKSPKVTTEIIGNKVKVTFEVTFVKPIPTSNIIIRVWDDKRNSIDTIIFSAITVIQGNSPDTIESQDTTKLPDTKDTIESADTMIIKRWAGYDSESATDTDVLNSIGIQIDPSKNYIMPSWVKVNTGKWVSTNEITYNEFVSVVTYLYDREIIKAEFEELKKLVE